MNFIGDKEEGSSATDSLDGCNGCNGGQAEGRRQNKNAVLLLISR
ncbi:hypothetical protein [Microcoleus sp. Pol8_D1]